MSNILRGLVLVLCAGAIVGESSAQWIVYRLHPSGALWSEGARTSGDQHVGRAQFPGGPELAGLWNSSSSASWTSIDPGRVNDVSGGKQVGSTSVNGQEHAVIWSGTGSTFVDLHPVGEPVFPANRSRALGVSGAYQVGMINYGEVIPVWRACLWTGTAASRVDIGMDESCAVAVGDGEVVGW